MTRLQINPAEDSSAASALPGNCQHLRNVICTVSIWLSDKLGGRKWLAVLSYRLFALLMALWMLKTG